MERTHEVKKILTLVKPQSMTAGSTVTGSYKSLVGARGDVLFNVPFGVLAQDKTVKVEVFQADDGSGTNAEEIADAETTYTSPSGGVTEGQILVSVPVNHFSRDYATVKITNTAASAVLGAAEMILDMGVRNSDVNSQASALTVV